ncbi:oxygenase MpaB family protein [Kibdelosporangium phytohabitans]|uniref:ER-bound oxygenase mpaB/mpaB'/Rubber oxygenase catalytic domain-containing protein n=1 Tax=Kibdelosporangium phytohabitans TaxID=860235 RepID=A0A0N9IBE3_9PSEU|nr:oxygenase MpaB family protein [Kibdelosporangium phytohabitans]ALG13508.1 hypothetical protein AOZ06_47535 [Kibdelosporangium phytohabitans]MBE1465358.1 uncharacterized protein (DUF2236 family) [Kibdelosporangium phytohabitans]
MLGPDSESWRHVLDWRLLLGSGRALLLQVAHPTVGAGVAQYSDFLQRPWHRLRRTVDSLMTMNYGQHRAVVEAKRLREMHESFKGIDHHGHRYSALNPDAYWWVHATLFEGTLDTHANYATPIPRSAQERLYREWREMGEVLGLNAKRMPDDLDGFFRYFDSMVAECLEDNASVRKVLGALGDRRPQCPPGCPPPVWRLLGPMSSDAILTATVGTLPPVLRARFGLQWTERGDRNLGALKLAVRLGMPLLPDKVRYHPMALAAKRAARP